MTSTLPTCTVSVGAVSEEFYVGGGEWTFFRSGPVCANSGAECPVGGLGKHSKLEVVLILVHITWQEHEGTPPPQPPGFFSL